MSFLERAAGLASVRGYCAAGWEPVLDAFCENFESRGELGASLCLRVGGEPVVDLVGGHRDPDRTLPWEDDTLCVVFSSTKGATALCAHVLADRGQLDLNAPVSAYWPEFARNGKAEATVAMMLNHSVGVPGFRDPLPADTFADWDYMAARVAEEAPFWSPGVRAGYHFLTFGWTVGEIVRRACGRSLGTFFQEEIARPLGLDFWIGAPPEVEARIAPIVRYQPAPGEGPTLAFHRATAADPQSITACATLRTGGYLDTAPDPDDPSRSAYRPNTRLAHAAEVPGAGGITNARGLAGMYDPLANDGGALVSADQVVRMSEVSTASMQDAVLLMPMRFTLGFVKSLDNRHRPHGDLESLLLGRQAFGHSGAGGSLGFADPECRLAFGYAMNQMGLGIALNSRGQALVDAAYRCLGYRATTAGAWTR